MPNERYQRHRDRVAQDQRNMAAAGRDIGKPPRVKNARRRKRCERDLRKFLQEYFPDVFALDWSPDHVKFLESVQARILTGGRQAIAMPRGSGKTSILLRSGLWALLYGHRHFLALIAAEGEAGEELADQIRIEIETNTRLGEDFPEVCHPVRALEGINNRANAQTIGGKRTHLRWKGRTLIFPTVAGSKASGAIVRVAGITGRIRGMAVTTADGENRRPDIVLVDDFQTDESARSAAQCAVREKIISGAVLGLAGPGKKSAAFASCTVIQEGDAADRILNQTLHARWRGERCQLVYQWPSGKEAETLWSKYLELRGDELTAGDETHPKATAFYKANRAKMDAGAVVGWEARKLPYELSALQHAYGLRDDNAETFDAEYQNAPRKAATNANALRVATSDDLVLKTSAHARGQVPDGAEWIVAGVDVQKSTLWWTVAAVDEQFRGWVLDYGVFPEQPLRGYFTLSDVKRTYSEEMGIDDHGAALQAALHALAGDLFARRYNTDDGQTLRLDRAIVDAGNWTDDVYNFCRNTDLAVLPSHGVGVTAKQTPWSTVRKKRGERRGFGWVMPKTRGTASVRHVNLDTNTWKTAINRAWLAPANAPASWALFAAPPLNHRQYADNITAEYPTETSGRGRTLWEWALRPGRDNHWLDSTLLAAAAGVMLGAAPPAVVAGSVAGKHVADTKPAATRHKAAGESSTRRKATPARRSTAAKSGGGGSKERRSLSEMREAARARREGRS